MPSPLGDTPKPEETHEDTGQGMLACACIGVTQHGMSTPQTHSPQTQTTSLKLKNEKPHIQNSTTEPKIQKQIQ